MLLRVPEIPDVIGESQAKAVYATLQHWDLTTQIQAMSFDTTASNSGVKAGACTLLEKKIGRPLLSLACRHYILELIVARVHKTLFGSSTGPEIKMYQRFKKSWNSIDKKNFQNEMSD